MNQLGATGTVPAPPQTGPIVPPAPPPRANGAASKMQVPPPVPPSIPTDEAATLPVTDAPPVATPTAPPAPDTAPPAATNPQGPVTPVRLSETMRQVPSWLVSMVFHLVLIIVMALWVAKVERLGDGGDDELVASQSVTTLDLDAPEQALIQSEDLELPVIDHPQIEPLTSTEIPLAPQIDESFSEAVMSPAISAPPLDAPLAEAGTIAAGNADGEFSLTIGDDPGDILKGRLSERGRAALVKADGGTPQSEAAVGLALKWLANHQLADGSWSFDHTRAPKCGKQCRNPGALGDARIAATAMGLLPFLGQGHTQKSGDYKRTVDRGLYFLTRAMRTTGGNGSLNERGGQMYGHGLASIALCEAYGLTHDQSLKAPAQACLNYIVMAQDPVGGGWRYSPRQPGDTSVVGWQLMALKSGHMAYLKVPPQTVAGASQFLDEVQDEYGARYGYTGPGGGAATSAIGLLCRLYLGWKPTHNAMQRGAGYLEKMGPSINDANHPAGKNNFYYNYYATQVMHHLGGYPWQQWNAVMRDYLIKTQAQKGHETGSWYFDGGDHGQSGGGRLYFTSLSAMILEVYYRHMPLYRKQSVLDSFGN